MIGAPYPRSRRDVAPPVIGAYPLIITKMAAARHSPGPLATIYRTGVAILVLVTASPEAANIATGWLAAASTYSLTVDHRTLAGTSFSPSQTSALTIGGSILGVHRCIGRLHSQQGIVSGAGSCTSL